MILWHYYYYYYYLRQIFQLTCITFELEEKSKSFLKIGLMKLVKRLNQMSRPMHEANSMQMHKQRLFLILSLNHATPFIRPFVLIVIMNVCGAACCLLVTDCLCAYLPMMVILCMWVFVWHRERDVITLVCGCTLERERSGWYVCWTLKILYGIKFFINSFKFSPRECRIVSTQMVKYAWIN